MAERSLLPVRPLHDWLLLTHLFVFLLPIVVLVGTGALALDLRRQTVEDIEHQAALLSLHMTARIPADVQTPEDAWRAALPGLNDLLGHARAATLAGYRVVDTSGTVRASSNGVTGDNLAQEPEVTAALESAERVAWSRDRSAENSLRTPLSSESRRADVRMFVAEPVVWQGRVLGAIVVSRTPREELQTFWQMAPRLSAGTLLALLCTVGLAFLSGRVLSASLRSLSAASFRMAAGDLHAIGELDRARSSRVAEARDLAGAMGSMATRLRARLTYIGEFASHVSHEFKTPVTSLRGTVELLLDDPDMPPAHRDRFLANALADLDRLTRLVSGLLRLARAEEGSGRKIVLLDDVVAGVLERHPLVRRQGAGGRLDANPDQLSVVLDNLIQNAEKYGGEGVSVTLRQEVVEQTVVLSVEDDGAGISPGNLPRVFDRFFTTGRERGGTGLGLALVRAVVESHGGTVTVTSKPGHTAFVVRLPHLEPN